MNRRLLGSGAVVCSALAIYGWIQPSALKLGVEDCGDDSANAVSSGVLKSSPSPSSNPSPSQQGRCSHSGIVPMIGNALELLPVNIQWGRNRSVQIPGDMEQIYGNVLKQAQADAEGDRLVEAVSAVTGIPKNSQYYELAHRYQEDWSQELLQRATDRYQQADIEMALSMLNAIPSASQHYARVNELHQRWSKDKESLDQAITAKDREDWQGAIEALETLKDTPLYHSLMVQELLQHAINNLFKPDDAFMQLVSSPLPSTGLPTSVTRIPLLLPINQESIGLMEPMPESTTSIDLNQALEWAQPPRTTVSLSPSQPSGTLNSISNGASTTDLTLVKPSDFLPESDSTQPTQKPLSGNLASKP